MKHMLIAVLFLVLLTGCVTDDVQLQTVPEIQKTQTPPSTTAETEPSTESTVPETTAATEPTEPVFDPGVLADAMSLEEQVGQLFLARCPDVNAVQDIETYHLGGYILFGRDFEGQTPESLRTALQSYQSASAIPMLIAVDEEGGTVARVSAYSAFRSGRFPSPRKLYSQGGMGLVLSAEVEKCQLLKDLGINVNMAPVCDVTTDPDAFMYRRSLGESPEITGEYVRQTVQVMAQFQVGSVLKHFPGYGNNADTHTGIAVDSRELDELWQSDLVPFAAGIEAGCGAILVSHTIVECLDTALPASLSPTVHEFLRTEMDFDGVIVTDDLVMEAITGQYGDGEAAVLAVLAGNDLLCVSNYQTQYAAVLAAVQEGRISAEMLRSAVCRILQWKYDLGLLTDSAISPENSLPNP